MKKSFTQKVGIIVLLATLVTVCAVSWASRNNNLNQLNLLVDVRHALLSEYYIKPDSKKMTEDAIEGMIKSLNDPFTVYFAPDEIKNFHREVHGKFSGIGARINIFHGMLHIVTPLQGSPAWKAGILAGDVILKIDGKSTQGIKLHQAVQQLTGKVGTKVHVQVRHESGKEEKITITRQIINVRTIRGFQRQKNHKFNYFINDKQKIGYIRISQFTDDTAHEMDQALEHLVKNGVKGIIIDVRFNPGGLLESVVKIAGRFLDQGKIIVSVRGRVMPKKVYRAQGIDTIPPVPIVIIANQASASAAEILTGALKDNKRALFVGTRTFGKGSVQQVQMLGDGQGALKITKAHYYLPSGININRDPGDKKWGVDPSEGEYIPMTPKQVVAMIKIRRDNDVVGKDNASNTIPDSVTPKWIKKHLKDPQLAGALKAMMGKLETGTWPKVGLTGSQEQAMAALRGNLIRRRNLLEQRLGEIDKKINEIGTDQAKPATKKKKTKADKPNQLSPVSRQAVQKEIQKSQGQKVTE